MKAAVLYMLIIVTGQGDVHHSNGYPTLHMCEEARNVAEHGETIEKEAQDKAKAEEERRAHALKWANEHPPRKPVTEGEKNEVEYKQKNQSNSFTLGWPCSGPDYPYHVTDEFLIQDDDPADVACSSWGSERPTPLIKYAECVRQDK